VWNKPLTATPKFFAHGVSPLFFCLRAKILLFLYFTLEASGERFGLSGRLLQFGLSLQLGFQSSLLSRFERLQYNTTAQRGVKQETKRENN